MRPARLISIGAFGVWLVLAAIQYEFVAFGRYAWGVNLFRYLPEWFGWLLAAAALLVTTEEMRRGLLGAAAAVARLVRRLPGPVIEVVFFATLVACLWALHERHLFGDSKMLVYALGSETRPAYPETGAQLVVQGVLRGAIGLGLPPVVTLQLVGCLFGAAVVLLLVRAAQLLAPGTGSALVPLVVLSGGLLRVLAGRVELQPVVLLAAAAYLMLAGRVLRGSGSLRSAALAAGLTAWLQPLGLLLLPSVVALAFWSASSAGLAARDRVHRAAVGLGWAFSPLALHAVFLLSGSPGATSSLGAVLGSIVGADEWIRWTGPRGLGTDFPLVSMGHLKYLANATYALAPAGLPIAVAYLALRRRRIFQARETRFLVAAVAPLLVGACLIRPRWGPFDWDLLALAGLYLAFLAGSLLASLSEAQTRGQLATAVIGLQLLFVGIPLTASGVYGTVQKGPFSRDAFSVSIRSGDVPAPKHIAPWL